MVKNIIGPTQQDAWSKHRTDKGVLDAQWFDNSLEWDSQHSSNLSNSFRLNSDSLTESCKWVPLDVWQWHSKIVLFSGLWCIEDMVSNTKIIFDATYLSMPYSQESPVGRCDLVVIDAVDPDTTVPDWIAHPLSYEVSPLWWRINKNLDWAAKFVDLLSTRTTQQQWSQLGVVDELLSSIPMFSRAWSMMANGISEKIAPIPELSRPSWADSDSDQY